MLLQVFCNKRSVLSWGTDKETEHWISPCSVNKPNPDLCLTVITLERKFKWECENVQHGGLKLNKVFKPANKQKMTSRQRHTQNVMQWSKAKLIVRNKKLYFNHNINKWILS